MSTGDASFAPIAYLDMDYRRTFGITYDEFCDMPAWVVRNDRTMLATEHAVTSQQVVKTNHVTRRYG